MLGYDKKLISEILNILNEILERKIMILDL
jgi:hypothetical protein